MAAEEKISPMDDAQGEKRGRSTIEFPYLDLDDAMEMATGVHAVGGAECEWEQLAAHLKQAAKGGGFRLRAISAKLFGLLDYQRGHVTLTPLGMRITDPQQQRQARIDSFLTVPLYKAIYEKFRGVSLPPTAGLERAIEQLGVAPKQKDKARQVFMRSAKTAGFLEFGPDRLVLPAGAGAPAQEKEQKQDAPKLGGSGGGGGGSGISNLHPFIQGLLIKLPAPESDWPIEEQEKWLRTASNIFGMIYKSPEPGIIEIKSMKL